MDKGSFLKEFGLDEMYFDSAELDYKQLLKIYHDFKSSIGDFEQVATLLANTIQKNEHVHSVRWRVKDAKHLIKKIIRKAGEGKDEYKRISVDNYTEIVTDLVGIRVLHLFKKEWVLVCDFIDKKWKTEKEKTAYYEYSDSPDLIESYEKSGYTVKQHSAGYRSIHLVFDVNVFGYSTFVEIQVRTIFEEAWSEMDHELRYPDHSDDRTLMDMITTLNETATSADKLAERAREHKQRIDIEKGLQSLGSEPEPEPEELEPEEPELGERESEINRNDEIRSLTSIDGIERSHLAWLDAQERYKDSIEKLSMAALYPDSPYESWAKKATEYYSAFGASYIDDYLSSSQGKELYNLMHKIEPVVDDSALNQTITSILASDETSRLMDQVRIPDIERHVSELGLVDVLSDNRLKINSELLEPNLDAPIKPTLLEDFQESQKRIDDMLKVKGFGIGDDDES